MQLVTHSHTHTVLSHLMGMYDLSVDHFSINSNQNAQKEVYSPDGARMNTL